jgi:hypothetical protein
MLHYYIQNNAIGVLSSRIKTALALHFPAPSDMAPACLYISLWGITVHQGFDGLKGTGRQLGKVPMPKEKDKGRACPHRQEKDNYRLRELD